MSNLTEIRWHARAGQGAVTAAQLVAEAAMNTGKYMQAMPEYGPERMGAPLKAFTRVSDDPIEVHNNIVNPNIVVVLDDTLLSITDVLEGIVAPKTVIVNTRECVADTKKKLNADDDVDVWVVDASNIALESIGRDIPNTPLAGALARATGVIDVEDLKEHLEETFSEKFSEEVVQGNLNSVDRAYEEVVNK